VQLLEKYTKELQRWIEPFFKQKQPDLTTERCAFNIIGNHIIFLHVNYVENAIDICRYESLHFEDLEHLPLVLAGIVKKYQLENIPTYWLLTSEDYQLFLIETLPVAKDELREALNWRVRSLINYPIEEAVIDYFLIPGKKTAPNQPMVAAITAKAPHLEVTLNLLDKCNLHLTTIDIPELALRNLTALYENDEKTTAMLYFQDNTVILNISREKTLYFTRRIPFASTVTNTTNQYETLSLDILRYFDYFQSQWRHPAPTRVFAAAAKGNTAEIAKSLSDYLLVTVEPYAIKNVLLPDNKKAVFESTYLLTLGCALRGELGYVKARN
jgi:MSHA biogenesis protein MshI